MTINYSIVMPFERHFDPVPSTRFMQNYWGHSVTLSILYAIAIYVGQKLMKNRPPYPFRKTLISWNLFLAIFSICGTLRMTPEFLHVLINEGFTYSMCNASYAAGVTGFWTEMFALSKVLEFGDTVFLVLRKRPLSFLHWYHHSTVLIYTWHAYKDHTAAGRWFIWMNYSVHSLMYAYFMIRAIGWRLPKGVAMTVTCLQLAQMVMGTFVAVQSYLIKGRGEFCQQTYANLYFSFLIYMTYFALFAHFFYGAYFGKGNKYAAPTAGDDATLGGRKKKDDDLREMNGYAKGDNGHVGNGHVAKNDHVANGTANGLVAPKGGMKRRSMKAEFPRIN